MNRLLLSFALAALAVPSAGKSDAGSGPVTRSGSFGMHSAQPAKPFIPGRPGFPGQVHRGDIAIIGPYAGGYYDYGDFDGNRSFDPEKWNDWWHDRPDRAFPRWVWRNQDCTLDRMWWSGTGWRCTP